MTQGRKFKIGKSILEVKNISLSFGGVKAITDISFDVFEHEIRALIGHTRLVQAVGVITNSNTIQILQVIVLLKMAY